MPLDKRAGQCIMKPISYEKIEARPTRVRTSKRQTACAERGSRRGAAYVSGCAAAGPGDNIRRTVTVVERYRKAVKAFVAAIELHHREKKFKAVNFFLELRIKHQRARDPPRRIRVE